MADKPIDLEAVRQAEAKLAKLLQEHPELRNPARMDALQAYLDKLDEKEEDDGTTEEIR